MFVVQLLENLWLVTGKFVTSDIRDACLYKTREEANEALKRVTVGFPHPFATEKNTNVRLNNPTKHDTPFGAQQEKMMCKKSTGHGSTGDWSTGHYSTGDWSTGHYSTGGHSTGYRSTGDHSAGNWSTGNWSTGHWSAGHFCTIDGMGFGAFNKKLHKKFKKAQKIWAAAEKPNCLFFDLTRWVDTIDMTEKEKINNPTHVATGGYLKVFDYKEAFTKSVLSASKADRDLIRTLPNFDADVFLEISGVDLRLIDND